MAGSKPNGANRQGRRRWTFATCVFDEFNWTLVVDGRRIPTEAKPLELLRELLLSAGNVVSKDDLLDRIWPDVTVVEASLPTAVGKLRRALGDDRRGDSKIIETVPGIGYRLSGPVKVEDVPVPANSAAPPATAPAPAPAELAADRSTRQFAAAFSPDPGAGRLHLPSALFLGGALAVALAVAATVAPPARRTTERALSFTQRDAANALRQLDVGSIDRMLAAGWNPNTPFDREGNGAINYVLNICEWNRDHDQEQLLLMVRTLFDGGARLDHRNAWGDTPYSIAKAQRYCGPNHPVTRSIRTMCYAGHKPLGDRCLATYELARKSTG